jgi:hypothetical protein
MGRKKSFDTFKRDSILLEFMKKHKGVENSVSSYDIRAFLQEQGYSINQRNVGSAISRIMYEYNAPICYVNAGGYYWASRREEIERTIADMEKRRVSLQEHIDHLRNFII